MERLAPIAIAQLPSMSSAEVIRKAAFLLGSQVRVRQYTRLSYLPCLLAIVDAKSAPTRPPTLKIAVNDPNAYADIETQGVRRDPAC